MISSVTTAANLSTMFKQQAQDLSKVMGQIASGKRFARPSDDFAAFSKVSARMQEVSSRQREQDNIAEARRLAGESRALTDSLMKHIGDFLGSSGVAADWSAGAAALVANGGNAFTNITGFGGLDFGTPTVTFTTSAEAQTALDSLQTIAGKLSAFESVLNRQETLNTNIMAANQEAANSIGAIDEMSAMSQMASLTVRQNATVSMASQANLSQFAMLRLFA